MKKIIFLLLLCCFTTPVLQAQLPDLNKAVPKSFDVKSLTSSVMSILGPGLSLTDKQKPGVTDIISSFLSDKSKILPLKGTDPSAYNSKFGSLFSGLKTKLGTVLLADQMKKFMGMKPKTNDLSNVLSNLFY